MISLTEILIRELGEIEFGVMEVINVICNYLSYENEDNIIANNSNSQGRAENTIFSALTHYRAFHAFDEEICIDKTISESWLESVLDNYVNEDWVEKYPHFISLAPNLYDKLEKAKIKEVNVTAWNLTEEEEEDKVIDAHYSITFLRNSFLKKGEIEIADLTKEELIDLYGEEEE